MASTVALIDTPHTDMIHDAQLDYYGSKLATCSSDRTIKVFNVAPDGSNQLAAEIKGHEGPVWQVQWAHPKFGALLASCSYDQKVLVHKEVAAGSWEQVFAYTKHESSVNGIAWAPHEYGLALATASSDGKVAVLSHTGGSWSEATIEVPMGCNAVSWAPFGHLGSQAEGGGSLRRLVTASCDNTVRIWAESAAGGWTEEATLRNHSDWVRDVAWAPSAGMPVNTVASCSEDKRVIIWTQSTTGGEWVPAELPPFSAPVWRVSWSLTGNVLAVAAGDQQVTLWKQALDGTWNQVSTVGDTPRQ